MEQKAHDDADDFSTTEDSPAEDGVGHRTAEIDGADAWSPAAAETEERLAQTLPPTDHYRQRYARPAWDRRAKEPNAFPVLLSELASPLCCHFRHSQSQWANQRLDR